MSKLLQTVSHPIPQDFSGKLSGVFGASARTPLFPVFSILFMDKQSKPMWQAPSPISPYDDDATKYRRQIGCHWEDRNKAVTVEVFESDGLPIRLAIRNNLERRRLDAPVGFMDLDVEHAKELANYLQEAITIAEDLSRNVTVLMKGRLRLTIKTEDEVPWSTPCDGQVRRLYFEGRECGEWRELATIEEPDLKNIRILLHDAEKAIAEMDPID